jgi:hydrogenase-4 component C
MPTVMIATLLTIAMALPIVTRFTPIPGLGDVIAVIYLFAVVRFFFALSGLDSGSSFAGIGGSRELTLGVLVEPTLILSMLVSALLVGTTDIGAIGTSIATGHVSSIGAVMLSGVACAFASYFELGKLPYDMAEAEQELQEGPLSEYSGPSLALLKAAMGLKQLLVLAFVFATFVPFGSSTDFSVIGLAIGVLAFAAKIGVVCLVLGVVENSVARARFMLTPRHSWFGLGIASLGFVFYLVGM